MKLNVHHVAFTVKDIKESVSWYEEKLGFTVAHSYSKNGMDIALLEGSGIHLELISYGNNTEALPEYRTDIMSDIHVVGTKHLCLEVDSLEESITELKTKGVEFVTDIDTAAFGGRYIFFTDCNGILIELHQS
ncbi:MAG TPA: VOC family protein [Patescibacteria group bacterium]|nr:VOC family protein [Patescibacteria group bacterium]